MSSDKVTVRAEVLRINTVMPSGYVYPRSVVEAAIAQLEGNELLGFFMNHENTRTAFHASDWRFDSDGAVTALMTPLVREAEVLFEQMVEGRSPLMFAAQGVGEYTKGPEGAKILSKYTFRCLELTWREGPAVPA